MTRALRLISLFARVSIQNFAAYRFELVLRVFMAFAHVAAELFGVWILFHNAPEIHGWRMEHMLALVGVFRIVAGGIRIFIVPNMRALLDDIRSGRLDYVLLKPVNAQLLVSIREFVVWRVADVLLGAGVAIYGGARLAGTLNAGALLQFAVTLAAAAAIVYSLWLMLATLCFWFVRINNIEMIFWNVFEAGRFPIVIYRPWVQSLLTFVIPLAFITTIPAAALTGRNDSVLAGAWAWALLIAAVLVFLSNRFWRFGLRHYSGASA